MAWVGQKRHPHSRWLRSWLYVPPGALARFEAVRRGDPGPDRLCDLASLEKVGDHFRLVVLGPVRGGLNHMDGGVLKELCNLSPQGRGQVAIPLAKDDRDRSLQASSAPLSISASCWSKASNSCEVQPRMAAMASGWLASPKN